MVLPEVQTLDFSEGLGYYQHTSHQDRLPPYT